MPSDFTLVADMSRVGMTGCMWSNARIPQGEDNLYKFVRLAGNPWFDERLLRIAKVCSVEHSTTHPLYQHTHSIPAFMRHQSLAMLSYGVIVWCYDDPRCAVLCCHRALVSPSQTSFASGTCSTPSPLGGTLNRGCASRTYSSTW